MLYKGLADLHDVKAIRLREQVKRNPERFSETFMFQMILNILNKKEITFFYKSLGFNPAI